MKSWPACINESMTHRLIEWSLLGCLVGVYLTMLTSSLGRSVLNTSSLLLLFSGLVAMRHAPAYNRHRMLVIALLALGFGHLVWYAVFNTPGGFSKTYRAHSRLGVTLVITAMLVWIVSNVRPRISALMLRAIAIAGGVSVNLCAVVAYLNEPATRVSLEISFATTAAYALTALNILMFSCILGLSTRWRFMLLIGAYFLSLCAMFATGTRSAMLVYPLIFFMLCVMHVPLRQSKAFWRICAALFAVTLIGMVLFKSNIDRRLETFKRDIRLLEETQSDTSVGGRVAMLIAGQKAGILYPLGQSVDQRAATIRQLSAENHVLAGAQRYLGSHMHNEFIESLSLRGIPGVVLLAAFYAALLVTSLRSSTRNAPLFSLTVSMILYGMVDVIFFNRDGYLVYLTSLMLMILFSDSGAFARRNNDQAQRGSY